MEIVKSMGQGVNNPNWDNITSPIPAMRTRGEVLFNCSVRLNTGEWVHFEAGQRGGGYAHVEGDGGCLKRDAINQWGGL